MRDATTIRSYDDRDREAVVDLWRRTDLVRPWNDPDRDIDRKVAVADGLLLVADRATGGGSPVVTGTVMAGYDGHRGWINYLAVHPADQGLGIGAELVGEAERRLLARGCPKVNLMVRSANAGVSAFYEALGYTVDDVVALGKRLIPDA